MIAVGAAPARDLVRAVPIARPCNAHRSGWVVHRGNVPAQCDRCGEGPQV